MSFDDQGFLVVKNYLEKDFVSFIKRYFDILIAAGYSTKGDSQVDNAHCFYSDPLVETILSDSCQPLSELIGVSLLPTYTYARKYLKGDELKVHQDRESCQISATLSLAIPEGQKINPIYFSKNKDGTDAVEILLEPGDLCIYRGCDLWHWREPFEQPWYLQAFLHYVDANGPYKKMIYDKRPCLAIPR
jgi:hypothetical protein